MIRCRFSSKEAVVCGSKRIGAAILEEGGAPKPLFGLGRFLGPAG